MTTTDADNVSMLYALLLQVHVLDSLLSFGVFVAFIFALKHARSMEGLYFMDAM